MWAWIVFESKIFGPTFFLTKTETTITTTTTTILMGSDTIEINLVLLLILSELFQQLGKFENLQNIHKSYKIMLNLTFLIVRDSKQ